jgi:hypothetical protein
MSILDDNDDLDLDLDLAALAETDAWLDQVARRTPDAHDPLATGLASWLDGIDDEYVPESVALPPTGITPPVGIRSGRRYRGRALAAVAVLGAASLAGVGVAAAAPGSPLYPVHRVVFGKVHPDPVPTPAKTTGHLSPTPPSHKPSSLGGAAVAALPGPHQAVTTPSTEDHRTPGHQPGSRGAGSSSGPGREGSDRDDRHGTDSGAREDTNSGHRSGSGNAQQSGKQGSGSNGHGSGGSRDGSGDGSGSGEGSGSGHDHGSGSGSRQDRVSTSDHGPGTGDPGPGAED